MSLSDPRCPETKFPGKTRLGILRSPTHESSIPSTDSNNNYDNENEDENTKAVMVMVLVGLSELVSNSLRE